MEPVDATPTRPLDYALISAVFAAGFGGVAWLARTAENPIDRRELLPLGLATFTLTRVLTEQKVETWLRRPFVVEPPDGDRRPQGRGLRYAIGELLSCTRCTGSWVGLGLVGLRLRSPTAGRTAATVGTIGAINDTALAAFAWLTGVANRSASPEPDDSRFADEHVEAGRPSRG